LLKREGFFHPLYKISLIWLFMMRLMRDFCTCLHTCMPKAQEKSRSKTDGKDANTIAAARTMMNGTFWINHQPH